MNDFFLVEPSCCETVAEFKSLLEKFGFEYGRYIVRFPTDWEQRVRNSFPGLGEIDKARLTLLLRRAAEKNRYHTMPSTYAEERSWLENAKPRLEGSLFQAAVAERPGPSPAIPKVETMDSLDLPATAEQRVLSQPLEFKRVTQSLLGAAREVWFIDPYLDPIKSDRKRALISILKNCNNAVQIELWAREECCQASDSALYAELINIKMQAGLPEKCKLSLHLVDDRAPDDRMHARYVISKFGGVRFDQGIQVTNSMQDVMPVMQQLVDQLIKRYAGGASNGIIKRCTST